MHMRHDVSCLGTSPTGGTHLVAVGSMMLAVRICSTFSTTSSLTFGPVRYGLCVTGRAPGSKFMRQFVTLCSSRRPSHMFSNFAKRRLSRSLCLSRTWFRSTCFKNWFFFPGHESDYGSGISCDALEASSTSSAAQIAVGIVEWRRHHCGYLFVFDQLLIFVSHFGGVGFEQYVQLHTYNFINCYGHAHSRRARYMVAAPLCEPRVTVPVPLFVSGQRERVSWQLGLLLRVVGCRCVRRGHQAVMAAILYAIGASV